MDRLKQIESFAAVATKGSLTAAALAEGVAPAVIGRRIDALEERLGVKLLVRTTRRITLTHEGSAFLEDCQRILSDIAQALGMDPLDVRMRNLYSDEAVAGTEAKRDTTHYGMRVEDNILQPLLSQLERTSGYRQRRGHRGDRPGTRPAGHGGVGWQDAGREPGRSSGKPEPLRVEQPCER